VKELRVLATLAGVVMAIVILTLALTAVGCDDLPPTTNVTVDQRLTITTYYTPGSAPNVYFMRDRVTDECWIAVQRGNAVALAKANDAACARGEVPK